ncbi:gamma-glutamylcyclotransferase [Geobacillus stearothermophilus]|uniref:gamma-glutamylcyclotransferase family protein n=1 Tax=Geobacillus stearothermophilus TaxID=1422 RepID=UPI002E21D68B|nr:gamma-glutamylcyclotransferase [Geobacillus stearothermophilus]MED5077916.1 gamma-glutamylcyclotransferase [Geobacillus stearothermophilus]
MAEEGGEAIFQRFAQLGSSAIAYNQLGDPETALAILDQLEGYHGPGQPNHYERITVTAIDADGEKYTCYTYVYPSERKEWLEQHAKLKA